MTRQQRKAKAKLNRKSKSTVPHIRHKQNGGELLGFYWGYNANLPYNQSFELSNMTLINMGMTQQEAVMVGKTIKEASDQQLQMLIENRTQKELGLTRKQFIAEEWTRLFAVIDNLSYMIETGKASIGDALKDYIVGCCAVSTLVAAGEIPQDTYNGDQFSYSYSDVKKALA